MQRKPQDNYRNTERTYQGPSWAPNWMLLQPELRNMIENLTFDRIMDAFVTVGNLKARRDLTMLSQAAQMGYLLRLVERYGVGHLMW